MQDTVAKCAKNIMGSSVSSYGQNFCFLSIPEESNQHIVDADCKVVQGGGEDWKQEVILLFYSMKIIVWSGMITKKAIMGFHSFSRGQ